MDRTTTIRASINDVEVTLLISIFLVILVVFRFPANVRATLIPSVAVPRLAGRHLRRACICWVTAWTIFR